MENENGNKHKGNANISHLAVRGPHYLKDIEAFVPLAACEKSCCYIDHQICAMHILDEVITRYLNCLPGKGPLQSDLSSQPNHSTCVFTALGFSASSKLEVWQEQGSAFTRLSRELSPYRRSSGALCHDERAVLQS